MALAILIYLKRSKDSVLRLESGEERNNTDLPGCVFDFTIRVVYFNYEC